MRNLAALALACRCASAINNRGPIVNQSFHTLFYKYQSHANRWYRSFDNPWIVLAPKLTINDTDSERMSAAYMTFDPTTYDGERRSPASRESLRTTGPACRRPAPLRPESLRHRRLFQSRHGSVSPGVSTPQTAGPRHHVLRRQRARKRLGSRAAHRSIQGDPLFLRREREAALLERARATHHRRPRKSSPCTITPTSSRAE